MDAEQRSGGGIVRRVGLACLLLMACGGRANSQVLGIGGRRTPTPAPTLRSFKPPGVVIGAATELQIDGQGLDRVDRWLAVGEGVTVEPVGSPEPGTSKLRVTVDSQTRPGRIGLRALGPGGLSNLAIVRVDRLTQLPEVEPNNEVETSQKIEAGAAVFGTLDAGDFDHYRVEGRRGESIVLEVEARRLGSGITPVLELFTVGGRPIERASETRGLQGDARLFNRFREDGAVVVRVQDLLYRESGAMGYRLRVEAEGRYATGLYPLGGPSGRSIAVEVSGGNLESSWNYVQTLPETPGSTLNPGPFETDTGPIQVDARLVAGTVDEVIEPIGGLAARSEPLEIGPGMVANGRIERAREVDRYRLKAPAGETVSLKVRAADLGSWLDSVLRVTDLSGKELAINDDEGIEGADGTDFQPFGNNQVSGTDSRLGFRMGPEGSAIVEVADRYGDGGPEYGYRLEVESPRPDFELTFVVGQAGDDASSGRGPGGTGADGSLNLDPGASRTLNFLVTSGADVGPITIRVEGLPAGVTSEPTVVEPPAFVGAGRVPPPTGAALTLIIEADASASLGSLRFVGRAEPKDSEAIERVATAQVTAIGTSGSADPTVGTSDGRTLDEWPVWVRGDARPAALRPDFVGPPAPVHVQIVGLENPGFVLQGGYRDLTLKLDPEVSPPGTFWLEGEAEGEGLRVQTILSGTAATSDGTRADTPSATIRVVARPTARPGPRSVAIGLTSSGGPPSNRVESIEVRPRRS